MIDQIHHVAVSVSDMDRSLKLYRDILGFEVSFDIVAESPEASIITGLKGAKMHLAMIKKGGSSIELFQYLNPIGKPLPREHRQCDNGITHIALSTKNFDEALKAVKEGGYELYSDPQKIGNAKVVYFKGPDGETLELLESGV